MARPETGLWSRSPRQHKGNPSLSSLRSLPYIKAQAQPPRVLAAEMPARDATAGRKVHEKAVTEKRQMAMERKAASAADVQVITLEHGEHHDSTIYQFEKGCRLRFEPGPSLYGRKVFLYTNYVLPDNGGGSDDTEYERNQYYGLEWRGAAGDSLGAGLFVDDSDVWAELRLNRPGPFHYYFVYDTAECPLGPQGSGWLQVAPSLTAAGVPLPLDAVVCQTVLAKCLGPLSRWEAVLRVAKETGYNMIHFTPVQELGASGSSYSVSDQLRIDPRYGQATFSDLGILIDKMRNEWGVLSICDVVLNHTANETPWLSEHPEATYNCRDCPHLRPAALLDAVLAAGSAAVARGKVQGAPSRLASEDHLSAVRADLGRRAAAARIHELFQCDEEELVRQFSGAARQKLPLPTAADAAGSGPEALKLLLDPLRRRRGATVDLELALRLFNVHGAGGQGDDESARILAAAAAFRNKLRELNAAAAAEVEDHLHSALDNCIAGVRYFRLQADGPKLPEVTDDAPLVPRYFTWPIRLEDATLDAVERCVYSDGTGAAVMAHNGWVMEADPLQDFAAAEAGGRVYLRRELIAWGDSVKLRYGASPSDSPFLWAHMRSYVEQTAITFAGLRLDNCHSTPLHVAEYLLDAARRKRPDLYVVAELFTNSDKVDNIFVNRLGITALIREAQSAWDAHEQGRLVHRFGGRPVGGFLPPASALPAPARPAVARAVLLDMTHDNPSPIEKRCVFDLLPSAALAAAACCAAGSTRGYDDLVPHQISVVEEERLYPSWADVPSSGPDGATVSLANGILRGKMLLNRLHAELASGGYSEVFVDQMDEDTVAVTRHNPQTRQSVILVAVTAFRPPDASANWRTPRPLRFEGSFSGIALEATLLSRDRRPGATAPPVPHTPHARYLTGLADYECEARADVPIEESRSFKLPERDGAETVLPFKPLPPGAVVAIRVTPAPAAAAAAATLHAALAAARRNADPFALRPVLQPLDLADLNALLYRCDAEERDAGGPGVYDVPGLGPFPYAGLQGVAAALEPLALTDDLGHPLCDNLRDGDWLADYVWQRLDREPRLRAVGAAVRAALKPLQQLPRFLQPAYFHLVISAVFGEAVAAALARLASGVRTGPLARALALTSVQLVGAVKSAPLPALATASPSRPASLSAGLPHFSTGYTRCWGRDTFVALPGLLLRAGRPADARAHLLAYAACLRHGLIPNLLDGGPPARYNSRDAVWWWLEAVQRYCEDAAGGAALLDEPVARLWPADDLPAPAAPPPLMPLHAVVQEALEAHFQGRAFRERNAGPALDAHMTDRGFDMQIGVHPETGFPFGGNDANCGTWMDKMGSSERAGTRGRPATPRDGSAIELVALCYSCVSWLARARRAGQYPHDGVRRGPAPADAWTWQQWAERLHRSFERHFWVPEAPSAADARPDLVHRRGIYKDSHGASQPWADYQLRCNCAVAMAVAPALFEPRHAWAALDKVERHLLGPLGLKTLDPADWAYRPAYDNSNDSTDPSVAHGFNYHQGPEWGWPLGFYLRARLAFAHDVGKHARAVAMVARALGPLRAHARASPWRGLPELTNAAGAECAGSCRSQAWSSAAALDALGALAAARRATALD